MRKRSCIMAAFVVLLMGKALSAAFADVVVQSFLTGDISSRLLSLVLDPYAKDNSSRILGRTEFDRILPRATRSDYLVLQYWDSAEGIILPSSTGGAVSIELVDLQHPKPPVVVSPQGPDQGSYLFIYLGGLPPTPGQPTDIWAQLGVIPGDIVKVTIHTQSAVLDRYFRFAPRVEPYYFGQVPILYGLNAPFGLTSIVAVPGTGVTATFQPIAIGYGWKYYPSPEFFLGLNLVFGYTGYAATNSSSGRTESFTFTSGTMGLYLDIDNFFFVGGGYTNNFADPSVSPGWIAMAGIGTSLSDLLKR